MAKTFFYRGIKAAGALSVLLSASLLISSCEQAGVQSPGVDHNASNPLGDPTVPLSPGLPTDVAVGIPDVPPPVAVTAGWDTLELMVRTNPVDPINERFLGDWRFEIVSIDDDARPTSPLYFGETDIAGHGAVILPAHMLAQPLLIIAYNEVLPPFDFDGDENKECISFEIFIPAHCYDKAVWLVGPVEDALWDFYEHAAERSAEAWNPSQVDCGTWLGNLQQLVLTDRIDDELNDMNDTQDMIFDEEALILALQENQQLLVPTRPPICMAELRHNGGGMERAEIIDSLPVTIDDDQSYWDISFADSDPIVIGETGIVESICGVTLSYTNLGIASDGVLNVNGNTFTPDANYYLDDEDFMGTIHDVSQIAGLQLDVSVFNVKNGDGFPLDHDKYDDACALTSIVEFSNTDDDEHDIDTGSGVLFTNLFGSSGTNVWLTSDGDQVVDDNDYWAIFYNGTGANATAIAVEFLGHRQEDFRDVLHMTYDILTEDLFLGLRADYELNEEEVDGERAFMGYTISVWDGSTDMGRMAVRNNIANCYEASDPWARQFFVTQDFQTRSDECCFDDDCELDSFIEPLLAAEFAVRSQCFSNSRANSRWQSEDAGFWAINTIHGVAGNVVINPGWLAPDLDYEIYIQKFDEAVFKGPRLISRTDDCGQLMAAVPTLVEGDRVLIKAEDNCCSDYKIAIPCVPEFTGFVGLPGLPYVPAVLGPPPGAIPAVGPVAGVPVATTEPAVAEPVETVPTETVPAG